MKTSLSLAVALPGLLAAPAVFAGSLIITEVQSNQAASGVNDYWELTNVSANSVSLGNYKWDDDSRNPNDAAAVTIPAGTTIAAGESIIFTAVPAASFRTWWNLPASVQVISATAPGLGQNDAIALFDASGTEVAFLSYGLSGFTRSDGSAAAGGHAGASAGGTATQALIWDPTFGTAAPRYTNATGSNFGSFVSALNAGDIGSPGYSGFGSSGPTITLSLAVVPSTFSESAANPAATGTVTRTGATTNSLVVNLASSDTTEATLPASVTIPAGQASATFDVTAVDDTAPDGNKVATLTATATDATAGTANVTVADDGDVVASDLRLTEIQSSQSATAPGTAQDYWELTNFGDAPVSLTGYSWHDSGRSSSAAQAWALPSGASIAPGESVVFTVAAPADFRSWWGISGSVQVFQSPGAPGLGKNDGISLFDNGGNEVFFFSYAAGGFTRSGGSPSTGDHAGLSAGGSVETQALILDPHSTKAAPRYTFASGTNFGSFQAVTGSDTGSPGVIDKAVDLSTYVRTGRYNLPEPTRTTPPANNLLCQEASGVTYNWDTDTLFIVGDGGRSVTQVSKTGALIDTMTLPPGSSPQGTTFYDTEGITYLGGGQFVMSEERDRQLVKFTYVAGSTLTRAATQTVKIGTFVDNTGTEGLSYDPLTDTFICVKEISPMGLFQTGVDFAAGTATNGSPTTVNSVDLFNPSLTGMTDFADVFALPNRRLLVLSQEDGKIINISRSGAIASTLAISSDSGNPLSVAGQQHEGVTMDRNGVIYVVNENGGGDIDHPQLWVYAPSSAPNQAPTAVAAANAVTSIIENTGTVTRIKVADIIVTDDGLGANTLSIAGPDAASFEIADNQLFIKAGVVLDFETKSSYSITIQADDSSVGSSPDATTVYTLAVTDVEPEAPTGPALIISEVAPWSSGNSPASLGVDWFEVTNTTNSTIDITGWKVDDSSASFGSAAALNGITSIAPGESVIFMETSDLAGKAAAFRTLWFGANPPAALQIGSYTGSGLGLSTGGDGVNLFNAAGVLQASVSFGASPAGPAFPTFDNGAGLDATTISLPSAAGVFGAFAAVNDANEIGSPGSTGGLIVSEVAAWGSGNSPAAADWFELTNKGARTVDITGWRMDDSSASPVGAVSLNGITSIAPGESVVFLESATPAATVAAFLDTWFGATPPAGLQVGTYTGSGVGLSTGGDAIHVYDGTNTLRANVFFAASDNSSPYATFDNAAGINNDFISLLSTPGSNGGFVAKHDTGEIGSPGKIDGVPLTGFQAWLADKGYGSEGFEADSDKDGLADGVEYFFNLNPNSPLDPRNLPQVVSGENGLDLQFTRLTDTTGATGLLEVSPDLSTWHSALSGIDYEVTSETAVGEETDVSLRLLGSGPSPAGVSPAYTTPYLTPAAGASLGGVRVVNHGLVGAGRLSGESVDSFGETMGAGSGLFVSNWNYAAGQFSGTFNVLPDRGFNSGSVFSNYAARLHKLDFTFTPYEGAGPVSQTQIVPSYVSTDKFTYQDGGTVKFTTGFNPTGTATLFGQTVGVVTAANGPGGAQESLLSIDAEAVHLFEDGSGYFSDEYGTYIARFNPAKQITGITQLPEAARPHTPAGVLNFDSVSAPTSGRRNNQGLEGLSVTPDGTRLFALMQSALVQDTSGSQQQTRNNTRLFVFDIEGELRENPALIGEYVVKLPRFDSNGDGSGLDRTAAQSEIIAVGEAAFLMLPRDGNGLGTGINTGNPPAPTVLKSVRIVDFASATNILGSYDGEGAAISPGGVLNPAIVPAASEAVVNMLAPADLAKFGFNTNNSAPDSNTINEKWEGMALVPDLSTPAPDDFFLFIANDNDFQSSNALMIDGSGNLTSQGDARSNAGNGPITNDATFLAYRVTIDAGGKRFYRMTVEE